MSVNLNISTLGGKFRDYRKDILGDSFNWGPAINASKIKNFTFHHSVTKQTAKKDGNWRAECNYIAGLHISPKPNGRGWGGIGYRFVICSDGIVAYVGDLSHGGSAVKDRNDTMFSACFIGDFTKQLPTDEQITSAHELAKFFIELEQYPGIKDWDSIKGHKEFSPTACPGTIWKAPTDSMYERIKNRIPYIPQQPLPPPASTPEPDCEKQVAGYKSRVTDLTNKLARAEAEEKNRTEQVERVKRSKEETAKLNTDLEKALKSKETETGKLLGSYKGRIAELEGENDELGKDKGKLRTALAECRAGQQKAVEGWVTRILNKIFK